MAGRLLYDSVWCCTYTVCLTEKGQIKEIVCQHVCAITAAFRVCCCDTYLDTSVLARNGWLDESSVTKDQERRASNEPEHESKRTREPEQRNADDEKTSVKALLRNDVLPHLHGFWRETIDSPESKDQEDDGKEKQGVVDHAVDGKKCNDDCVVAGKVTGVVCDALESFVGVLWTRDALVIEEFAEGTQTRESLLS